MGILCGKINKEDENMKKVYLAAPFETLECKSNAIQASTILGLKGFDVYCPWKYKIPNAWDYPNDEWGAMVFATDIKAIQDADLVVVLSYGRYSTAGTNWEAGYAFGIGKKVIVVEMTGKIMSVMVSNGRYATVEGLNELESYDFNQMPQKRSYTEQK